MSRFWHVWKWKQPMLLIWETHCNSLSPPPSRRPSLRCAFWTERGWNANSTTTRSASRTVGQMKRFYSSLFVQNGCQERNSDSIQTLLSHLTSYLGFEIDGIFPRLIPVLSRWISVQRQRHLALFEVLQLVLETFQTRHLGYFQLCIGGRKQSQDDSNRCDPLISFIAIFPGSSLNRASTTYHPPPPGARIATDPVNLMGRHAPCASAQLPATPDTVLALACPVCSPSPHFSIHVLRAALLFHS